MNLNSVLLVLAVIAGVIATLIGFGHLSEQLDDLFGWLALSLTLLASSFLPFDRYQR